MLAGAGKLDITRRMEIGILQCTVMELGRNRGKLRSQHARCC